MRSPTCWRGSNPTFGLRDESLLLNLIADRGLKAILLRHAIACLEAQLRPRARTPSERLASVRGLRNRLSTQTFPADGIDTAKGESRP